MTTASKKLKTVLLLTGMASSLLSFLPALRAEGDTQMPRATPAPEHGPQAMTMEGFPWLPYDLTSRRLWVEATGLWCERCFEDTKKNLSALASVESVDIQGADDAKKASWITIKLKKDAAVPSDDVLSAAIKEAGYSFVKSYPERVLIAEITGAFSSMCQGVIQGELLGRYKTVIDELAIEVSKEGRAGRSLIKMRLTAQADPIKRAQLQKLLSKYNFKLENAYMLDINGKKVDEPALASPEAK